MKQIAFIINPISGNKKMREWKNSLPELITNILDKNQWTATLTHTEYANHATELAQYYAHNGFDAVVAVGGDGTVNEVARGLRDTQTALGILPMGSGNGLARHLRIPLDITQAIAMLNYCRPIRIDYGLANDHLFVSTCGTGFDAEVANRFAGSDKRGFITYLRIILHLVFTYKSQNYRITGNSLDESFRAFLITFANANQWGNAALIAPKANLQDGLMDIMIMSPYALLGSLPLAIRLFMGNIDRSSMMHTLRASEIILHRASEGAFHVDGDPIHMGTDISIQIVKGGLYALCSSAI